MRTFTAFVVCSVLLLTTQVKADVALREIAGGFSAPLYITSARDGSDRLFVVEQAGIVKILKNGSVLPTPFLDISSLTQVDGERGLIGFAFHPKFASTKKVYADYIDGTGDINVAEFTLSLDSNVVDPATKRTIIVIPHRENSNHNGGQLAFGPDGFLYIGVGDGGGAGDVPGNAQNRNVLLGKILRLDVDHGAHYSIPRNNPFVGKHGVKHEIYAYGLRNPFRFSFDRTTGKLFAGDVGQDRFEEVDQIQSGKNYGWNTVEGTACFKPSTNCSRAGLTSPLITYSHSLGNAVIGGYVYHGKAIPSLVGRYIFADFGSGRIWSMSHAAAGWRFNQKLSSGLSISSLGEDESGGLYVIDYGGGAVYKLEKSK